MAAVAAAAERRTVRFPVYEFLILFIPIAALVLLVGFSFVSMRTDAHIEDLRDLDSTRLHHISGFIGAEVASSLNHLRSLGNEELTQRALDRPGERELRALEASFVTLARRNPYYRQVRWIDESGMERIRIRRAEDAPVAVAARDLRDQSRRHYFATANSLLSGELYISRIEMAEGDGDAPRPTLRIAQHVEDSQGRRRGIIVIDVDMTYLFEMVGGLRQERSEAEYILLNQDGTRLNTQTGAERTGAGDTDGATFAGSNPEVWEQLSTRSAGSLDTWSGLWTWQTLSPVDTFHRLVQASPQSTRSMDRLISDDFSLTLVAHRPVSALMEIRREIRIPISLGVLVGLAVYGTSLALYLSGHVRERRAELNAAYAMAKAASLERLKELEERFHHLVEASSIGQLVVDAEGKIELCNRAAEEMLGFEHGELVGASVDTLLPAALRQTHRDVRDRFMQAPSARLMGAGRELTAITKDGTALPVEIGLNPYTDAGRQLVLASIIDRSVRA